MHKLMDMANVLPGDGYIVRKGGGEVSVNLKGITRVGGVDGMAKRLVAIYMAMPEKYKVSGPKWYPIAHQFAVELSEIYNLSVWQVSQVIAVLSPQNPWDGAFRKDGSRFKDGNRICAVKVIKAFFEGGSEAVLALRGWGYAPAFLKKAITILEGGEIDWTGSPKTHRFAMQIDNPTRKDIVVVDSHASRIATGNLGDKYHVVEKSAYLPIERAYVIAADVLGIDPDGLQGGTWEWAVEGGLY